jgi:hypothetical protein
MHAVVARVYIPSMADEEALRRIIREERDAEAAAAAARAAQQKEKLKIVGVIALVIGLLLAGYIYVNRDEGGMDDEAGLACALTLGGVGLVVSGFTRNQSPAAIAAGLAVPSIGGYACDKVVERWAKDPSAKATITVNGENAQLTKVMSLTDLLGRANAAPPTTDDPYILPDPMLGTGLVTYCANTFGTSQFLYDLCIEEGIKNWLARG